MSKQMVKMSSLIIITFSWDDRVKSSVTRLPFWTFLINQKGSSIGPGIGRTQPEGQTHIDFWTRLHNRPFGQNTKYKYNLVS